MFRKAFINILRSGLILLFGIALFLFTAELTYSMVKENDKFLILVIMEFVVAISLFNRFEALAAFLAVITCCVIAVNTYSGNFDTLLNTGHYSLCVSGCLVLFLTAMRVCCLLTYIVSPKVWDRIHDKRNGMFSILPDIKFIAGLCSESVVEE